MLVYLQMCICLKICDCGRVNLNILSASYTSRFFSVARDSSLHEFLDSFLQFRSRWYDFPHRGAKGIVAGVIVGELELSRRVFMVLYRM